MQLDEMESQAWMSAANPQSNPDAAMLVSFETRSLPDPEASAKAGTPKFRDVDYVKIRASGDKLSEVHRAWGRESDVKRFGRQYEHWKKTGSEDGPGWHLSQWPGITRSQVEELRFAGIKTVEQLAAMSDSNAQSMGAILAIRQKARDALERAKGEAPVHQMRAELAKRDNQIEVLQRQMKQLMDELELERGTKPEPKKK